MAESERVSEYFDIKNEVFSKSAKAKRSCPNQGIKLLKVQSS